MKDSSFEQIIKKGVLVLEDVFPKQKYLYFPLLYTTLFWMLRRPGEWKKKDFFLEGLVRSRAGQDQTGRIYPVFFRS